MCIFKQLGLLFLFLNFREMGSLWRWLPFSSFFPSGKCLKVPGDLCIWLLGVCLSVCLDFHGVQAPTIHLFIAQLMDWFGATENIPVRESWHTYACISQGYESERVVESCSALVRSTKLFSKEVATICLPTASLGIPVDT